MTTTIRPLRELQVDACQPASPARTGYRTDLRSEDSDETDEDALTDQVNSLLNRVSQLVTERDDEFKPKSPGSITATGLTAEEIEKLILKFMSARGSATGREVAAQICMPYGIVESIIKRLRAEMLVTLKGAAEAGDYEFCSDGQRSQSGRRTRSRLQLLRSRSSLSARLPGIDGRSKRRAAGSGRRGSTRV